MYNIQSMSEGVKTYTKEFIISINSYDLRSIPNAEKYKTLLSFVSKEKNMNLSSLVSKPMIPSYLKKRYGDVSIGANMFVRNSSNIISFNSSNPPNIRNNIQHLEQRRQIYTHKGETTCDKINEEIRDLLSKLSEGNKDKLFQDFMKKEIPDECGQPLIDNIYSFAVDQMYLIHLYVELIFLLKKKNVTLYDKLINKIISNAHENIEKPTENQIHQKKGNMILISTIYKTDNSIITFDVVRKISENLMLSVNPQNQINIKFLCELLINIQSELHKENEEWLSTFIHNLEDNYAYDKSYDGQYRFMIQDLVEKFEEI